MSKNCSRYLLHIREAGFTVTEDQNCFFVDPILCDCPIVGNAVGVCVCVCVIVFVCMSASVRAISE